jgi:hypothetical protein
MRETISPLPQYAFMAWYSVKQRNNFTFTQTYTSTSIFSEQIALEPTVGEMDSKLLGVVAKRKISFPAPVLNSNPISQPVA